MTKYGEFHERFQPSRDSSVVFEKHLGQPFMSHSLGFGSTIPLGRLNCGNTSLPDVGGLEGYEKAFITVKNSNS